jgi:hypothetical protein
MIHSRLVVRLHATSQAAGSEAVCLVVMHLGEALAHDVQLHPQWTQHSNQKPTMPPTQLVP